MRRMGRVVFSMVLLGAVALPLLAAVPPASPSSADVPVAIAQPLGAMTAVRPMAPGRVMLPESGLLVLVGSGLLGLASIVRRSTRR